MDIKWVKHKTQEYRTKEYFAMIIQESTLQKIWIIKGTLEE